MHNDGLHPLESEKSEPCLVVDANLLEALLDPIRSLVENTVLFGRLQEVTVERQLVEVLVTPSFHLFRIFTEDACDIQSQSSTMFGLVGPEWNHPFATGTMRKVAIAIFPFECMSGALYVVLGILDRSSLRFVVGDFFHLLGVVASNDDGVRDHGLGNNDFNGFAEISHVLR